MSPNGLGTWKVRPIPSLHRAAWSSLVTLTPPNVISPEAGARSPAMRPNRLVLPAPFGPTIPTMSPEPTLNDKLSATTTLPKLFVTPSSSSRAVPAASGIRRLELCLDLHVRVQGVVHDLHLERELARGLLPLDADRRDDADARGRAAGEVERAAHPGVVHVVQRAGDLSLVMRVGRCRERLPGHLEQRVGRADRLHPLIAGRRRVPV